MSSSGYFTLLVKAMNEQDIDELTEMIKSSRLGNKVDIEIRPPQEDDEDKAAFAEDELGGSGDEPE